ncbi:hypothetical protein LEP1GSC058_3576 [Leptospira fainei serovar Hurstbridge str. BUT 6]|uniref:Uncharacterized protein n=1 Tax=Leptospira fainei serovar Hurstbridge str. BUT 6 TaxID=1193011 RepID=S3V1F5_9LEPT|nr:hypothetical protein [Leptospira fainei]EPG74454.1 hypothetical protein LEP1GSC058_3576 [Leptospira fainei serovar Hurstbridge str. BUT 6]
MKANLSLFIFLSILSHLNFGCIYHQTKEIPNELGYAEVEVQGANKDEAERNAKIEMIGLILGELVQSQSIIVDSNSKDYFIESSREGLIRNFKILSDTRLRDGIKLRASGYVSKKLIGNALDEQYKFIGKPRILVLISEKIGNKTIEAGNTGSEARFISFFPGFEFLNKDKVLEISSKIKNYSQSIESEIFRNKVVESAVNENCELVLLGSYEVRQGGTIVEGSDMRSTFAGFSYKLIETRSQRILAADTIKGGHPAIDLNIGSDKAIEQILNVLVPSLKQQLASKWQRGYTINLAIEGMNYDSFVDMDISKTIRSIRGINSVTERGQDSKGRILLDIEALFNAGRLYSSLRDYKDRLGFSFHSKQIEGNSIVIEAEKALSPQRSE